MGPCHEQLAYIHGLTDMLKASGNIMGIWELSYNMSYHVIAFKQWVPKCV